MKERPLNAIRRRFGDRRVLLPVIHCISELQARTAADVAHENHADGVFLINQGGMAIGDIGDLAANIASTVPFVGINLLGRIALSLYSATHFELDAIWSDRCDLTKHDRNTANGAFAYEGLFFGGVAFKYQPAPSSIRAAVQSALAEEVDVLTTSGAATGQQPTLSKIVEMRTHMGPHHALAIASGIQPGNVEPFLPYVDAFLVATGIETTFGTFDPARVRALADLIHEVPIATG